MNAETNSNPTHKKYSRRNNRSCLSHIGNNDNGTTNVTTGHRICARNASQLLIIRIVNLFNCQKRTLTGFTTKLQLG